MGVKSDWHVRIKKREGGSAWEIWLSGTESKCEALGSIPSREAIKYQLILCTVVLVNGGDRKSWNHPREGFRMQGLRGWLKEEVGWGREGDFMSSPSWRLSLQNLVQDTLKEEWSPFSSNPMWSRCLNVVCQEGTRWSTDRLIHECS